MKIERDGKEFELVTSLGLEDEMTEEEFDDMVDVLMALVLGKHYLDGED